MRKRGEKEKCSPKPSAACIVIHPGVFYSVSTGLTAYCVYAANSRNQPSVQSWNTTAERLLPHSGNNRPPFCDPSHEIDEGGSETVQKRDGERCVIRTCCWLPTFEAGGWDRDPAFHKQTPWDLGCAWCPETATRSEKRRVPSRGRRRTEASVETVVTREPAKVAWQILKCLITLQSACLDMTGQLAIPNFSTFSTAPHPQSADKKARPPLGRCSPTIGGRRASRRARNTVDRLI